MKIHFHLFSILVMLAAVSARAEVPGTIWIGSSADLYRDGKLLCSTDPKKNSIYLDGAGYAELHEGGLGWIWPLFAGGCANHVGNRLQLQIVGSDVKDNLGQTVGTISPTTLLAKNFMAGDRLIESLEFSILNDGTAKVNMVFKYMSRPEVLKFRAEYSFYRNER